MAFSYLFSQSEELAESDLHFKLPIQQAKVKRFWILAKLGLYDETHLKKQTTEGITTHTYNPSTWKA